MGNENLLRGKIARRGKEAQQYAASNVKTAQPDVAGTNISERMDKADDADRDNRPKRKVILRAKGAWMLQTNGIAANQTPKPTTKATCSGRLPFRVSM